MSTLHVRNVPDALYSRIQAIAGKKSHSISAEVVDLLEWAVAAEEKHAAVPKILAEIRRHRITTQTGAPGSVELIREDRDR